MIVILCIVVGFKIIFLGIDLFIIDCLERILVYKFYINFFAKFLLYILKLYFLFFIIFLRGFLLFFVLVR